MPADTLTMPVMEEPEDGAPALGWIETTTEQDFRWE
jgi:hypothetical protein